MYSSIGTLYIPVLLIDERIEMYGTVISLL